MYENEDYVFAGALNGLSCQKLKTIKWGRNECHKNDPVQHSVPCSV